MLSLHQRRTQFPVRGSSLTSIYRTAVPLAGCSFDVNKCLLQGTTRDSDGRSDSGTMSDWVIAGGRELLGRHQSLIDAFEKCCGTD